MTLLQTLIHGLATVLDAVALAGLLARGRWRLWYAFALQMLNTVLWDGALLFWPGHFFTPERWQVKERLFDAIDLAMALELAVRIFRGFPAARARLAWIMVLVVAATVVNVWMAPMAGTGYTRFVGEIQPRLVSGTTWLFIGIAVLVLWYRLPVRPFHKAVLLSYVPYLVVFSAMLRSVTDARWQHTSYVQYGCQIAYVVMVAYWVYVVWRRDPPQVPAARLAI